MKRHDITVLSKESIPDILNYFNIEISTYYLQEPSYNPYGYTWFAPKIKNPQKGLLGVYFKPRSNPFDIEYPDEYEEHTLDNLLKYEIAIEEAFVFWDTNQPRQEENINTELIVIIIFAGQNKEEAINSHLIENQIIKEPKLIKLGCYNITPNTGLVAPLPLGGLGGIEIDAVYFDDGIRLLPKNQKTQSLERELEWQQKHQNHLQKELNKAEPQQLKAFYQERLNNHSNFIKTTQQDIIKCQLYTIEDLLKLSNGAKNIYLFACNTRKEPIHIDLPDSLNPYDAIHTWKRDNNLYNYEGKFEEHSGTFNKVINIKGYIRNQINISGKTNMLVHTFETETKTYRIICQDTKQKREIFNNYCDQYVSWLEQCYIKPGIAYTASEIKNKFGRSSRDIYDEDEYTYRYVYKEGFFYDDWFVNEHKCVGSNNTFSFFFDTTRPPTKPKELS